MPTQRQSEERKVLSHASIIAAFTILSKVLGLLRDRLFASTFGPGTTLDSYYAAFRIPDFIFNLIVLGTVSAAFVPIFLDYVAKKQIDEAYRIANTVMNAIFLVMAGISLIAFIFAHPVMRAIAPGFNDPETLQLSIHYMRIMLLSPMIFGFSSVVSGILSAYRRFVAYSLAPALYNLGIVIGILVFVPWFGVGALAWGVVLGATMHLLAQLPSLYRVGFRWRPYVDFKSKGLHTITKLMLPRMFGFAALQISLFVTIAVATTLPKGSTTIYSLAVNLQYFAVTIFGTSIATAVFPLLATAASKQDVEGFRHNFSLSFRKTLFFMIPASVLLLLFRAQVVRILLGYGKFDWDATVLTLQTLAVFAFGLFAQALMQLATRAFYALQNTRIPVILGVICMTVNIGLSLILAPHLGVPGLALADTVADILNAALLIFLLRNMVGYLDDNAILASTIRITLASLGMGFVSYGLLYATAAVFNTHTVVGIFSQAALSGLGGIIVYVVLLYFMKSKELSVYAHLFSRKVKHE
jgi:putative peptidoglycan lipid II flippase